MARVLRSAWVKLGVTMRCFSTYCYSGPPCVPGVEWFTHPALCMYAGKKAEPCVDSKASWMARTCCSLRYVQLVGTTTSSFSWFTNEEIGTSEREVELTNDSSENIVLGCLVQENWSCSFMFESQGKFISLGCGQQCMRRFRVGLYSVAVRASVVHQSCFS